MKLEVSSALPGAGNTCLGDIFRHDDFLKDMLEGKTIGEHQQE